MDMTTTVLAVCTAISTICAALAWISKGWNKATEPNRKQDERLTELESRMAKAEECLGKDKTRIEAIEEGNRITQRALLALLSHGISGDGLDSMLASKKELEDWLIKR